MTIARQDKESSRAERKLLKRKLENAIPDLPGDADIGTSPHNSMSTPRERQSSNKKQKRSESGGNEIAKSAEVREDGKKHLGGSRGKGNGGVRDEELGQAALDSYADDELGATYISVNELKNPKLTQSESKSKTEISNDVLSVGNFDLVVRKSKKERKAEKKAAESSQNAANNPHVQVIVRDTSTAGGDKMQIKSSGNIVRGIKREEETKAKGTSDTTKGKAPRFIVFIGNLPFSATIEAIQKHFAAVHPKSVRYLTRKDDNTKSRGCAFVEFDGYDHMKACLKSYHHSNFDDGISAPRKINVELTAGGGGNKTKRHAKIGEKNQKLNEERIRRMQDEEKARLIKRGLLTDHSDIHPSRRARISEIP